MFQRRFSRSRLPGSSRGGPQDGSASLAIAPKCGAGDETTCAIICGSGSYDSLFKEPPFLRAAAVGCKTNGAYCARFVKAAQHASASRLKVNRELFAALDDACRNREFADACTVLGNAYDGIDDPRAGFYFLQGCKLDPQGFTYFVPAISPFVAYSVQEHTRPHKACSAIVGMYREKRLPEPPPGVIDALSDRIGETLQGANSIAHEQADVRSQETWRNLENVQRELDAMGARQEAAARQFAESTRATQQSIDTMRDNVGRTVAASREARSQPRGGATSERRNAVEQQAQQQAERQQQEEQRKRQQDEQRKEQQAAEAQKAATEKQQRDQARAACMAQPITKLRPVRANPFGGYSSQYASNLGRVEDCAPPRTMKQCFGTLSDQALWPDSLAAHDLAQFRAVKKYGRSLIDGQGCQAIVDVGKVYGDCMGFGRQMCISDLKSVIDQMKCINDLLPQVWADEDQATDDEAAKRRDDDCLRRYPQ